MTVHRNDPEPTGPTPSGLPGHLRAAYEILASGAAAILPVNGLAERMTAADRDGRPLRVKLGIDPSGTDLTLGHAVVLRKLRQFQNFGHVAVLVVGGFTGQVGDPSGRTATRSAQSAQSVMDNARDYFAQVMQILDAARCEVVNNADWLAPMVLGDLLAFTRQITVAQLLERDDFRRRFKANEPITLSEFFYPLLQGIDSVEIRADIELGGTDQTFNNLVGRELQRGRSQSPQAVLTMPLLVGTDGVQKMGKSLGNFIAIAAPAAEQFGQLMSVPDDVVGMYAQLCTDLHPRDAARLAAAAAAGGSAAGQAKRAMARAVVSLYHGAEAAAVAEQRFDATFRRGELPEAADELVLTDIDPAHLPTALVAAGFAPSTSAARRLVESGAVKLDGVVTRELDHPRAALLGVVLGVGKRRAVRLRG